MSKSNDKNQYSYLSNDVCVVGIGCVLPDANGSEEFFENLLSGKCSIQHIPSSRWNKEHFYDAHPQAPDKTYSTLAAFLDEKQISSIREKHDLSPETYNRLEVITIEAAIQALGKLDSSIFAMKKKALILGCMSPDESFTKQIFWQELQEVKILLQEGLSQKEGSDCRERLDSYYSSFLSGHGQLNLDDVPTSGLEKIKRFLQWNAESFFVDAACASSLAAMEVAYEKVRRGEVDFALTGGVETNLSPDTFVTFCKTKTMSSAGCFPFDKKHSGLVQGEGVVIFALERLEDALAANHPIYGILRSFGSSCDGKRAGLFSPDVEGQLRALNKAYLPLKNNLVDYIEAHGTGTRVGDEVEYQALGQFFRDLKIPFGTVKANIGHTKGTAGAAGALKCLLSMKERLIPPSPYFRSLAFKSSGTIFINTKSIQLPVRDFPLRMGVSSFGFGGTNYHLILEEYLPHFPISSFKEKEQEELVVLEGAYGTLEELDLNKMVRDFKIPAKSLRQIDLYQLLSLTLVEKTMKKAGIPLQGLNKDRVVVLSASTLGLPKLRESVLRVTLQEAFNILDLAEGRGRELLTEYHDKFSPITEDSGPGTLNNVLAGRVCQFFDFKGKSLNIDHDLNSLPCALGTAGLYLGNQADLVIVIGLEEKEGDKNNLHRKGCFCLLLSTRKLALENDFPLKYVIERINYEI